MRNQRGVTLLELMIATVVTSVVLAGVLGAVVAQQRAYQNSQRGREAEMSGQTALLNIEKHLKMAGFGMDPSLAFDFTFYGQMLGTDPAFIDDSVGLCPATMSPCRRDRVDNSDELVFHYRNPSYWVPDDPTRDPRGNAWKLIDVTDATATIKLRGFERFARGQVLQAVCQNAINWTYFTVATATPAGANNPLGTNVSLVPFNNNHPFLRQNIANMAGGWHQANCFRDGFARVFKIERFRYHIRPVQVGTDGAAIRYIPYLMLDQGIDRNFDGVIRADDELVAAEGVELMQIAYRFKDQWGWQRVGYGEWGWPNPGMQIWWQPMWAGNWGPTWFSDTLGTTVMLPVPAGTTDVPYGPSSFHRFSPDGPERQTAHQANIRQIVLSMLTRSNEPDFQQGSNIVLDGNYFFGQMTPGSSRTNFMNMSTAPPWIAQNAKSNRYGASDDGFRRTFLESRVQIPNILARGIPYF
jgi:type IV pilus assembly protein PilW